MTTWWWVRHGPTHMNTLYGWTDYPADLSDRDALDRLQRYLPPDAIVVASTLQRASATADAIQGGRKRLRNEPDLREANFGLWEKLTPDDLEGADRALAMEFWRSPGDVAPPGGESWNQVRARSADVVHRLSHAHAGKNIIAVSHFGVIVSQLQHATGMSPSVATKFQIGTLSVTCLEHLGNGRPEPGLWRVRCVNHRP
ncbi:MAG: histidine phosphatase family protein [Rhodobacteraceae bacterium]|nr:histidine phosphatase family protein [Paracoccaceae bacterium]